MENVSKKPKSVMLTVKNVVMKPLVMFVKRSFILMIKENALLVLIVAKNVKARELALLAKLHISMKLPSVVINYLLSVLNLQTKNVLNARITMYLIIVINVNQSWRIVKQQNIWKTLRHKHVIAVKILIIKKKILKMINNLSVEVARR